ncbi:MAG: ATP-binding protein [Ignavibacteriales bacterium]|nr:ATP-binding protein [Ignavibacteriales bacterium]
MIPIQHSLKTRILFVTGSVILLIMMLISLAILFQWRTILIEKEVNNAQSVVDAFTVPALDALIYAEQRELLKDDLLETYIDNYMQRVTSIIYIEIYDNNDEIVAGKDRNGLTSFSNDKTDDNLKSNKYKSIIYKSNDYGWLIDAYAPLKIAKKKWGVVKIGFDAEPIRGEINSIFFILLSLTILLSIVTLTVLYFLIDKVTFKLNSLVNQIDKIDFKSIEEIALTGSKDEIGFLINRFDDLLKRLKLSKQQLATAQKQVFQSEKLASIGRLASGVAHEINNPLNGIKNCLYSIQKEPNNIEQTTEYLSLINEGMKYIENVVKKLLGFAQQQTQITDSLNINEMIFNVYKLLEYKLKQKQTVVNMNLMEDIPSISADNQLIQEVIMNILINSYDATTEKGKITVVSGMKDEKHIFFSISDNGIGLDEKELDKIFDPFYTTKDPGEGTGLGLWVSLGIVENHNGQITVSSVPNKETTFTVILPTEVKYENNVS